MSYAYSDTPIDKYGKEPTYQPSRTIELVMLRQNTVAWEHELCIKPEEITYTYPTRATVIQTLGGAFVDDFGEGMTDIMINGHTGWRSSPDINGELDSKDGAERIMELRHNLYQVYHDERMQAAQRGEEPDAAVSLFFVDSLNEVSYRVYPLSLQVRKHKSRPLLFQYQLRLIGLEKTTEDGDSVDWAGLINVGLDLIDLFI